jgi:hypothetical protein
MLRTWAQRMAPDLAEALAARDAEGIARLQAQIDEVGATLQEIDRVRDSMGWLRTVGGKAPAPLGLWVVRNLIGPMRDAARRTQTATDVPPVSEFGSVPMNLDGLEISVG